MAVSKKNIRWSVTIPKELSDIAETDAKANSRSVSKELGEIIIAHYKRTGRYTRSEKQNK